MGKRLLSTGFLLFALTVPALPQEASPENGPENGPEIFRLIATDPAPHYATAKEAADAFAAQIRANDFGASARILGLDATKLKEDDEATATFERLRKELEQRLTIVGEGDDQIMQFGDKLWPLPFPIVKGDDGQWSFDTIAGLEEILDRRIGENELEAIETVRAYVDAQVEYFSADRDADGIQEYAQKLISTSGKTDGLYWPSDQGDGESPAGDGIDQAELDDASRGEGYFGYRFRILTGQGDNVAGGSYDYVINGNMIGGFALIAWPVKYGDTGIQTFVVNQQGIVYETDLGDETETIASYIDRFNPDDRWNITND